MGIISTLSDALSSSVGSKTAATDDASAESKGAYWCDDCDVRVRDVEVAARGLDHDDDGTPHCPDCGEAMRFERSHADGCAC